MSETGKQTMHIGFDDTDSTRRGCTTYVAALLLEKLKKIGVTFLDYPSLIRLNPNVPWKTRGNGALCFRIEYDPELENQIIDSTIRLIEANSELNWKGTNPGVVFLKNAKIPLELTGFSKIAERGIVSVKDALKLIQRFNAEALGFKNQRGIIGALAAIGETLTEDYTFELITYRLPQNIGSKRKIDEESIFQMDKKLTPFTFNNVDTEKHRVIITPRGPDPILFGIRGETPETVKQAFALVKPLEPIERWVIFRTNQGTDMHLKPIRTLAEAQPYSSIVAKGMVSQNPRILPVRHVIFSIKDQTTEIDCAAYEPTGALRKIARELLVGDAVEVFGAVRKPHSGKPLTVNLEKINVLGLVPKKFPQNPACPNCGKRLKSAGKSQGLRCDKCKAKFREFKKIEVLQDRNLKAGLYVTSTRSQRHLTKPLRRYGREKRVEDPVVLIGQWHSEF